MSAALHFFLNDFVPAHKTDDFVDLSDLAEHLKNFTPIPLKYTKPEEAIQNLATVIIMNFCNNYGERLKISLPCSTHNKNEYAVVAHRITLYENRKLICPGYYGTVGSSRLGSFSDHFLTAGFQPELAGIGENCVRIEKSCTGTDSDLNGSKEWKSVAWKTINHPQIIEVIEGSIREIFGSNTEIKKIVRTPMQIHFISIDYPSLRGFSGINEMFINENYFLTKINSCKSNSSLSNSMLKMDLAAIALHECVHVRIRQKIIIDCIWYFQSEKKDIICLATELNLFHEQIDWFQSIDTINAHYVEKFLDAIENGTHLPSLTKNDGAIPRQPSTTMGVDIINDMFIC
ncbi:unnamed protein product [Adineta ricciae]|uniref:Uncharacterized protein n=1 Tax=Adineta ricciae TaxID=249248 RepID=A0A814XEC3_ADIRI|nr:unnamed protein product [Adineta ricciae]